uniref:CPW-WPC domain-containing protein n=1 Tax=Zooxanthella nutricula TaxID=1333877 RepID=A0A7S2IY89_9DINO|mmetsp:Transcript_23818/g.71568  ORF Transcript_23818/g.71568 Transcript_23818/m.71568 type:complete len:160 (+) Transcript_23818:90-569(+)
MAPKAFVALALVVAALAQDAVPDAEIDAALGSDDTCGSFGDDAAVCALNALQRRALEVDAEADGEERGACDHGLVGQVKSFAPGCLGACPQACGPLGQAIDAYLKKGGQAAAKPVICRHKSQFACAYDHWGSCKTLVSKAAGFGFKLPTSAGALNAQCR